jgi:hypothetical protein
VGLVAACCSFTLLREAQIYIHLIYQEMARAKKKKMLCIIVHSVWGMFNRIWEAIFMTSVFSCTAVHL